MLCTRNIGETTLKRVTLAYLIFRKTNQHLYTHFEDAR